MYYFGQQDEAEAYRQLVEWNRPVAVDVETTSKEDKTPIGLSIAPTPWESFYFPMHSDEIDPMLPWGPVIQNPLMRKVYHNAMFDLYVMCFTEVELGDMDMSNIADTAIMLRLMPYSDVALESAQAFVGRSDIISATDLLKEKKSMLEWPEYFMARKCAIDSEVTIALYDKYLERTNMEYHDEEMKVVPVLIRMSNKGIAIDEAQRAAMEEQLTIEVNRVFKECELEGFNPGSPQQVGYILSKRGNILPKRRRRGEHGYKFTLTTDEAALELLDDPMARVILDYRHNAKILGTYIRPLKGEDRVYTEFHLEARTSRVSSRNRNLQNIPQGPLRNMMLPDSGLFTDIDYSQVELRILAYLSGDKAMQRIFDEDGDIHQFVADFMGIIRKTAKNVQFGMVYGATATTLRETAHIKDLKVCNKLIDKWFSMFPEAERYIKTVQARGLRDGFITTMFGRRISIAFENEDAMKRKSINYTIQGSAAEIMKRAIVMTAHLPQVLTIHDELLFDGDVTEELKLLDLVNLSPCYTPYTLKVMKCWE